MAGQDKLRIPRTSPMQNVSGNHKMTSRLSIILYLIIALAIFFTCTTVKQDHKLIEGDLYYSWLRLGSFYDQPDSLIERAKKFMDTVDRKTLDSTDRQYLKMYETLEKLNLLYKPYIDLKLDDASIIKIYFSNDEYKRIKGFNRQELLNTKTKIRIKTEIRDLGNGMALCTKLISADKVVGETLQNNKKLKINDYR